MYNPKIQKKERPTLFAAKAQASYRFLIGVGFMVTATAFISGLLSLRKLKERERDLRKANNMLNNVQRQRLVIIGGGTAGSALASIMGAQHPEVQVTVVEKEKQHTFNGIFSLAHVGHRSYDMNTTGGISFLRSPATYNVTQEANLVMGEVLKVVPKEKRIVVQPSTLATVGGKVSSSGRNVEEDEERWDGGQPQPDGTIVYPYDVLVVASGATRTLGTLSKCLKSTDLDNFRIAVNPGVTRDTLGHLFEGNILHVKVPPTSFVEEKEAQRKKLRGSPLKVRVPWACVKTSSLLLEGEGNSKDDKEIKHRGMGYSLFKKWTQVQLHDDKDNHAGIKDMYYPCRQHDGTFAATVNLMWEYLDYFKKFSFVHYIAVTADDQPLGPAPARFNNVLLSFWKARQESASSRNHFDFLRHSYITDINYREHLVKLYNYKENAEIEIPYGLLLLDLPLKAPQFIRDSNLHHRELSSKISRPTKHLEAEYSFMNVDPLTLQHKEYPDIFAIGDCAGLPTIKSYGSVHAQLGVVAHNIGQVLHNLSAAARVEKNLQIYEENMAMYKSGKLSSLPQPPPTQIMPRKANAKFDGYSSFHVPMTTWRAMWPEMTYNTHQTELIKSDPKNVDIKDKKKQQQTVDEQEVLQQICLEKGALEYCNHHIWDNTAWRDVRGFANGLYYQMFVYELMFSFMFSHGWWFSKTWFRFPQYSIEDGQPETPSWL